MQQLSPLFSFDSTLWPSAARGGGRGTARGPQAFVLDFFLSLRISLFSDPTWLTAAAVLGEDLLNSAGTCLTSMELQKKQLLISESELCAHNLLALQHGQNRWGFFLLQIYLRGTGQYLQNFKPLTLHSQKWDAKTVQGKTCLVFNVLFSNLLPASSLPSERAQLVLA